MFRLINSTERAEHADPLFLSFPHQKTVSKIFSCHRNKGLKGNISYFVFKFRMSQLLSL